MDQTAPLEDDVPTGPLIDAGASLANRLIFQVRDRLGHPPAGTFGLTFLRHIFRHLLRPAEAALRRAIYLLADTLDPEPAPSVAKPAHPRAGGGLVRQVATPRTPAFRLTEPQPRPPANTPPVAMRPRISIAGLAPPPSPRPAPDPVRLEDRLHRRLAAFDAAFRDPVRAARRLLRLLARRTARGPVLAFTRIPGLTARSLDDHGRALLVDMNTAIIAAFARGTDTS